MATTKVTVAIPTYNRAKLLRLSLASVLNQDYPDFQVAILDNASTDETERLVTSIADSRLRYFRNPHNTGLFRNWNRAIEKNSSLYLSILQDDDILLPEFISESVAALEQYPHAGFSTVRARAIDLDGGLFDAEPKYVSDPIPAGAMDGLDFLHGIVAGKKWLTPSSTVMMRADILRQVGAFDHPHCKDFLEVNLYNRLAACSDVVVIPKILCEVRFHSSRESHKHCDSSTPTGPLADLAERTDAIGYLMESSRAAEASYRNWLAQRLLDLSLRRSQETLPFIPALNYSWCDQLETARQDIQSLVPPGESFILADANKWGSEMITDGRRPIAFLERDGQYWGVPPDDATAILEVERLRKQGAKFIVFGWPAFWWLDYFGGLRDYLGSHYRRVMKNSRMIAFDLGSRNASL